MKKNLSLVVALSIILGLILTGCGNTAENKPSKPVLKPVDLTWLFPGPGEQKDVKLVEAEANKYLKDKINATITLKCFDWSSYQQKRDLMIASSEDFDIVFCAAWNGYWDQVAKGAFKDITHLMDQYAPKTKAAIRPDVFNATTFKGRNFAIPANKEYGNQYGFMIRKDIIEKYNLDISSIKNPGDIEPMLKVVKEKEPNMIPFGCSYSQSNITWATKFRGIFPAGDNLGAVMSADASDTKIVNQFETTNWMEGCTLARSWYTKGYVNKDAATNKDLTPLINAGKIFAIFETLKPGQDQDQGRGTPYQYQQIGIEPTLITTDTVSNSLQEINAYSKNPERALMFLELFNTDPYLNNLIDCGIEGTHYIKNEDGTISMAPGLDATNNPYYPSTSWMFGAQIGVNYLWKGEDLKKWDNYKTFNDTAKAFQLLGFTYDASAVSTEIAACTNVRNEFEQAVQSGTVDPVTTMPKFIEKLKSAGIDKIISDKQTQIDAFLAARK